MAIEWGPHTKAAAERQAAAIRAAATESRHHKLADRAASGEFTDYADTHAMSNDGTASVVPSIWPACAR